jgi:hypothetical protein
MMWIRMLFLPFKAEIGTSTFSLLHDRLAMPFA